LLVLGTRDVIPNTRVPAHSNKGYLIHGCFKGK
jgi:hypothetical protein